MKLWPRDVGMEEGTTLVVPALTIGNVPQLAVDLVAATLGFARAAVADHPALLPVACNDAYTSTNTTTTTSDDDDGSAAGVLSTAAELLLLPPPASSSSSSLQSSSRSKAALLQLRAPPAPRRRREWAAALAQFAKERGAARLLLLASADSSHAAATTMATMSSSSGDSADAHHPSFVDVPWCVASNAAGDCCCCCDGFEDCFAAGSADGATAKKERWRPMAEDARRLAIRDGSTSAAVLEECRARGVPCAALVALCAEGDNAADAARLAGWLCRGVPQFAALLKHQQQPSSGAASVEWKTPPSWGSAAFWGSSVDGSVPTLY